jgi:AcrR family transcriptional regulator
LGIKERQSRQKEAVGRAILDAARDLFVAEGYHNVSIRKIAEKIEYSPAAIYSYFPSKDDIFFALAEEGFRILFTPERDRDPATESNPIAGIRHAFWRVYEFSKEHPEYFALMFLDRSVPRISRDWERFAFVHEGKVQLRGIIQSAIDSGQLPATQAPEAILRVLLTSIVGAAVVRLCDRLSPGEDADALARDTLEATLTGLRTGFNTSFHPGPCPEANFTHEA